MFLVFFSLRVWFLLKPFDDLFQLNRIPDIPHKRLNCVIHYRGWCTHVIDNVSYAVTRFLFGFFCRGIKTVVVLKNCSPSVVLMNFRVYKFFTRSYFLYGFCIWEECYCVSISPIQREKWLCKSEKLPILLVAKNGHKIYD